MQPVKLRSLGPKQRLPHGGMNAVTADQHVAGNCFSFYGDRTDAIAVLLYPRDLRI
jgi:hypothetical protein